MYYLPKAIPDRDRFPSFNDDGKRPSTLFYFDIEIVAQRFGLRATWETLRRCGDLAKRDPYEVTELYIALNYLMNELVARIGGELPPPKSRAGKIYKAYEKMYRQIDDLAPNWPEDARSHFYRITD